MPKKREERAGWHWEGDDFVENTPEWEAQQNEWEGSSGTESPHKIRSAHEFIYRISHRYGENIENKKFTRDELNELYKQIRRDAGNGDPVSREIYDYLRNIGDPILKEGDDIRYSSNKRYNPGGSGKWEGGLPNDLPNDFKELPPPDEPPPSAPVRPDPTPYGPMAPPGPPNWRKRHGPRR